MEVHERIRKLRELQGWSQQELAEKIGLKTGSAINKIELGLREVNQSKLIALSKAFGVSISFLLDGKLEENEIDETNKSASRLREALNDANMTQAELCRRTGIDKASISYYLSGKYTFKSDKAKLMADVLRVSPVWLMGFDVEKYPTLYVLDDIFHEVSPDAPQDVMSKETEFFTLLAQLSPEQKQKVADMIKALLDIE